MKTLKQIRENIEHKQLNDVDYIPEDVMLEDHGSTKPSAQIPSSKQMPTMLLFRRITYRAYPKGQVVALYYSKMVDKYLSIPFGPGGNLNLSESKVYDTLEKMEEGVAWETLKGAAKGAWAGKAAGPGGALAGAVAGGTAGYIKGRYDKMKQDLKNKDNKDNKPSGEKEDKPSVTTSHPKLKAPLKHIDTVNKGDAIYQSKMKQATLKTAVNPSVNENKIVDIRKMVKENVESKDIFINGRQITLNTPMAKRILEVYDSVNTKNKKIVEGMLNENLESFKKLLNFSIRN